MMKAEAMGKKVVMTADDRMIEGIEMASLAVDSRFDFAKNHLTRAISNVKKAEDKDMEAKGRSHLKAIDAVHKIKLGADPAQVVLAYLDAGLVSEASRFCRD